jgi:hypothetical protein
MNANEALKLWVVEYSKHQAAFHVEEVVEMIEGNLEYFFGTRPGDDWMPLAFAESHEEAHEVVKRLRRMRDGEPREPG